MTILLSLFLLSTVQDAPPGVDERVQRLVVQLGDAAFDVRERATRELIDLGEAVAAPLRKRLETEKDPETKDRIRTVLARLEEIPLEAVRNYCLERLKGRYSPDLDYDGHGCGP